MRALWLVMAFGISGLACFAQGIGGSTQQSTTTTQTTTSKSVDGDTTTTTTTTRSETTSSGGGFSLGDLFGEHGGHRPSEGATYENTGGSWKIGEANGSKMCDLTLEKSKFISNYGARTSIGCPEGLFGVSSWILAGDEIRLLSPSGSLLAKLHRTGKDRWDGRTEAGLTIFMTRS